MLYKTQSNTVYKITDNKQSKQVESSQWAALFCERSFYYFF